MDRPFDTTLKQLVDDYAADWLAAVAPRFGLPATVAADPVDVDLSTVQMAADKVFRLREPAAGLVHIEPQSSWDGELPDRLLEYNALLHRRHGGPVYTVAVLLRPDANSPAITGVLSRRYADGLEYLRFAYDVMRVWELPAEPLMAGGLGLTPLALLTNEARPQLGALVDRIDARCRAAGVRDPERAGLLFSASLLCGLRYTEAEITAAFVRVSGMRDSVTYQAVLREGREEGRQEGLLEARRLDVLGILSERFGAIPPEVEARVRAAADPNRLAAALLRAVRVADPNDLEI